MEHIDQKILEMYVLEADGVKEQRPVIEQHLKECAGCRALHEEIVDYYADVIEMRKERVQESPEAITLRGMFLKVSPYDAVPSAYIPRTIPARIVLFVIRHYVVSSMSFVALIVAAVLALYPTHHIMDKNPSYARAKDEFLVAYNKEDETIWKKHIGPKYDESIVTALGGYYLATIDLDGNGRNEIIGIFGGFPVHSPLMSSMICFSDNGDERWKFGYHRQMTFGTEKFSDDYQFVGIMTGDFTGDGNPEIAAVARHDPYWPTSVVMLNAKDGTFRQEYWHCGWIYDINHKDMDKNGIEELFLVGVNNAFLRTSITVLDPRYVSGCSPTTAQYSPSDIPLGLEKYYILLPLSDLSTRPPSSNNWIGYLSFKGDGSIEIKSEEPFDKERYDLLFYFDSTMKCIKVRPTDDFVRFHRKMEAEGKLKTIVDEQYLDNLRRAVQYWDGDKFVLEPTMNRLYLEAIHGKRTP